MLGDAPENIGVMIAIVGRQGLVLFIEYRARRRQFQVQCTYPGYCVVCMRQGQGQGMVCGFVL